MIRCCSELIESNILRCFSSMLVMLARSICILSFMAFSNFCLVSTNRSYSVLSEECESNTFPTAFCKSEQRFCKVTFLLVISSKFFFKSSFSCVRASTLLVSSFFSTSKLLVRLDTSDSNSRTVLVKTSSLLNRDRICASIASAMARAVLASLLREAIVDCCCFWSSLDLCCICATELSCSSRFFESISFLDSNSSLSFLTKSRSSSISDSLCCNLRISF
mmetsp:Transcript_21982/g.30900  ORF Transcript_21982/g.30900 Transcript_21982/m.30900 type:complete len:220 (-) Transcript_21982:106-765(-)